VVGGGIRTHPVCEIPLCLNALPPPGSQPMRLHDLFSANMEPILKEWEQFAAEKSAAQ